MITFRRTEDQTYEASDGTNAVVVTYGWLRTGGWQWIVQDPRLAQQWVTGQSRKSAADRALRHLAG